MRDDKKEILSNKKEEALSHQMDYIRNSLTDEDLAWYEFHMNLGVQEKNLHDTNGQNYLFDCYCDNCNYKRLWLEQRQLWLKRRLWRV